MKTDFNYKSDGISMIYGLGAPTQTLMTIELELEKAFETSHHKRASLFRTQGSLDGVLNLLTVSIGFFVGPKQKTQMPSHPKKPRLHQSSGK